MLLLTSEDQNGSSERKKVPEPHGRSKPLKMHNIGNLQTITCQLHNDSHFRPLSPRKRHLPSLLFFRPPQAYALNVSSVRVHCFSRAYRSLMRSAFEKLCVLC